MAINKHSMPMLVIDFCSTTDDQQQSICHLLPRSFSLLNFGEAYKDLSGTLHYSSLNPSKNFLRRTQSCPQDSFYFRSPPSTRMHFLDPYNGMHSPAASSSRYSLYGSFFDLSEKGYHSSTIEPETRLLTTDGRPLLVVQNSSMVSANEYQEKCEDWLNHLNLSF